MKKLFIASIFCLAWSMLYAGAPDLIWTGGGLKVSNQSNPAYYADAFVWLAQLDTISLFSQPMLTLKGGQPGLDIGVGGRQPMMNGLLVGGCNLFYDYTTNNYHKRFGTGLELYHEYLSGHMNLYLPLSNENNGEEALSGVDLMFGIPVPNAPFVSVWPGFYYFAGKDRENMRGMSMMIQVQPIKPLYISAGGRNDTLQSGRARSELFFKLEFAIPLQRLGRDLFAFNYGEYPVDVKSQMDHRVMREEFITYEVKKR
jgi:hypothetical protein